MATRLGGIADAVRHEETGLLVREAAPEQIAAAVERLVADPGLARQLSGAGERLVRARYTRSASARAFAKLYDGLRRADRHPDLARDELGAEQTT